MKIILKTKIINELYNKKKFIYFSLGDWGLGIGPNPQSPSPIPNCYKKVFLNLKTIYILFYKKNNNLLIIIIMFISDLFENETSCFKTKKSYNVMIILS